MNAKKSFLLDMDGVLVRGRQPIPGAQEFIARLLATDTSFLVLTNNPLYTPRDLSHRLASEGLQIPEKNLFTSALATAQFLASQRPNGTAFVIGESGLTSALHQVGYTLTASRPEYVVLGETHAYNLAQISLAIRLVAAGARFIAINPDPTGPSEGYCACLRRDGSVGRTRHGGAALFCRQTESLDDAAGAQHARLTFGKHRDDW